MPRSYTDNTNASHPPGGKRHNPAFGDADRLPTEQGRDEKKKKKKKPSTQSARRTAHSER